MPQQALQEQARRELARREAIRRGLIDEGGSPAEAEPREMRAGPVNMAIRSGFEGLPIIGPGIAAATDHAKAAVQAWRRGEPFHEELKKVREDFKKLEEKHPNVNWASELAGSVAGFAALAATPMGAAALGVKGGGLGSQMVRGALSTGAISGADVAVRGGDAEDVATGATIGAVGGAAAPAIGKAAGRLGARARGQRTPVAEEGAAAEALRRQADTGYETARQAGLVVKGKSFSKLADGVDRLARDEGFQRSLHPRINTALREFSRTKKAGGNVKWQELESLRRTLGRIARSPVDEERFIAGQMSRRLDDFTSSLTPTDVVAGNLDAALPALKEARQLSRNAFRADLIDNAWNRAMRAESRPAPALRTEFRKIANNPRLMRQFSAKEQDAIKRVATLSKPERVLDVAGDLRSMVLSGALSLTAGVAGGVPPAGAVGAAGGGVLLGARGAENFIVRRQARKASEMVRPMSPKPEVPMDEMSRALTDLFTRGSAVQAAGPDDEELFSRARGR